MYKGRWRDKRVLVIGLARQGTALARFLVSVGARVTVTDLKPAQALTESLEALADAPIRFSLGGHSIELLDGVELVCLSGGVPADTPLVAEARRRSIPLSNDALLTMRHGEATVLGITGSSGKTTTTTLVGHILEAAGIPAHVGGNIGTPLIDRLGEQHPGDWAVMELSSFQLELFDCSPPVAAVTNVTPNHLDRHGSMAAYSAAKANILRWQTATDVCVLGADDMITAQWLRSGWVDTPAQEGSGPWQRGARNGWSSFPLHAHRMGFGLREELACGAFLRGSELVLRLPGQREAVVCRRDAVLLIGEHNVANLLAAACLSGMAGAPPEAMAQVAATFAGVEHRLETVRVLGDVRWVNDSIATSPDRAVAAIKAFDAPIVLLAGGRDKKLPWGEFACAVRRRVKHLVLFGEASDLIDRKVRNSGQDPEGEGASARSSVPIVRCADLEEAVNVANVAATPGDVVLLAPGGTSFDAYEDFTARGEHFRSLVRELGE